MANLKSEFKTEFEWLEHCSENGVSELQITFASEILSKRNDEKRVVDAYKWLFIALFLDNMQGKDLGAFVRRSMTDEQVLEADALVELWVEKKTDELLESRTEQWSQELHNKFPSSIKHQMLN
jgi:hypothetical protein